MADTLARPSRDQRRRAAGAGAAAHAPRRAPVAVVGALTAVGVAVAGLSIVTLAVVAGWIATAGHDVDSASALRFALQAWLLAHHATLDLADGQIGMVPLGLTAVLGLILYRGGRRLARLVAAHTHRSALTSVAALAVPYAIIAAALSPVATGAGVAVDPAWALAGALILATITAGLGVVREAGLLAQVRQAMSPAMRGALAGGLTATVVLLAGGLVATGVSLGLHAARVGELTSSLRPGGVGVAMLVLLGLALAPNAAVWAASYAAGPGFAVGAGTSVSLLGTHLGAVPVFPPLAALPASGPAPSLAFLTVLVPIAAATLAGWMVAGRAPADTGPGPKAALLAVVRPCLGAGVLAGALLGAAAWLSGGAAGPGRMAVTGPPVWHLALIVAGEIAAVALLAAWLRVGGARWLRGQLHRGLLRRR